MMMPRQLSATNIPLRILAKYVNLNDSQIGKVAIVREEMMDAMRPTPPPRRGNGGPGGPGGDRGGPNAYGGGQGGPGGFGRGQQPNFEEMQGRIQAADKKATEDIKAILTEDQRGKLARLVKALQALQSEGIRPDAVLKLEITEDQIAKLGGGRTVANVLTPEQQERAEEFRMPPGPGGFGGPGGPGGFGGPGGPGGRGGFGGPGGPGGPPPQE
jgi:hypothetical protein